MSHVAIVELEVKDLNVLADACARIGLEFMPDQKDYKWWGKHMGDYPIPDGFTKDDLGKCDHAIRIKNNKNAYEIGVVRRRDGGNGFSLMWDFIDGELVHAVGANCNKLRQEYAAVMAIKQARQSGFRVQEQRLPDGRIKLELSR